MVEAGSWRIRPKASKICVIPCLVVNSKIMKALYALCLISAAWLANLLWTVADPMIGVCNMTHFTSGGQLCQRIMITNLKNKTKANCSFEYQQQLLCLTNHTSSCLTGIFDGIVPAVTALLKLIFYHCGDLKVDPAVINQFLLDQIKCKEEVFRKTVECWNDFRARLNTNKSDPQLCRDYAVSKDCVIRETKTGCEIGEYLNRDLYNPFCPYNIDPVLGGSESNSTVTIGRCSSQSFASSVYQCQRDLITNLAKEDSLTCREEYKTFDACLSSVFINCLSGTSLSLFTDDVRRLTQSVLYHCGDLTAETLSVNPFITEALNCEANMFKTTVQCWDEFRLRLILNKFDEQLCIEYARAKQCVIMAVQSGCAIGHLMEDDPFNPFCTDGMDPLSFPPAPVPLSRRFTFTCDRYDLLKMGIACEKPFLDTMLQGDINTNCSGMAEDFLNCFQSKFEPCITPTKNPVLLKALSLLIGQILQGFQLLCEYPTKQLTLEDLPPILKNVASCSDKYNDEAALCGENFRSTFLSVPSLVCEEYENAKTCLDLARRSYCSFSSLYLKTLRGDYNPFCNGTTRPLFSNKGAASSMNYIALFASLLRIMLRSLVT